MGTVIFMLAVSAIIGRRTAKVSHKYSLIITPPGGFFAIWGIIYLSLIVAGVYCLVSNVWSLEVTILFGVVSILNGLWIYVFDFSSTLGNNLSSIILLAMVILNEAQWILMQLPPNSPSNISTWNIVNRNIIAFYQGWLVAACNLNLGVILVYTFGISKKVQTYIFWIICPLCILGMVLLNLSYKEGFLNNVTMYISAVYALVGAYISTGRNFNK